MTYEIKVDRIAPDLVNNPNLDPIQNNCVYGWVLPDRCHYNPKLGCDCGAYPALKWDGEKYVPR